MTNSGKSDSINSNQKIQFSSDKTSSNTSSGLIFDSSLSSSSIDFNIPKPPSYTEYKDQDHIDENKNFKTKYNNHYFNSNNEIYIEEKLTQYYSLLQANFKKESKSSKTELFNHLKVAQGSLDNSVNKVLDELKEVRNSVLGTIALFAAFFTFVSVNVNIFTKAESVLHALLFMFSMWLCIIGLISTFFYFLNSKKAIFLRSEFIIMFICIILSGVVIYFLSTPINDDNNKILKDQLNELKVQNKKIITSNENLHREIKDLKEDVYNLKRDQFNNTLTRNSILH